MKHDPESDELHDKLDECIQDAAELLSKLKGEEVLLPPVKQEGLKRQYVQGLQPIVHRMQVGMSQILEFLTSAAIQDPIVLSEETTQQLCQVAAIASVMSDNPQEYLLKLTRDRSLQDLFGLSDETMEKLYQGAKFLYEHQNYVESAAAFSVLCCITPGNYIFWMGFGNSEYFCHNYQAALAAYTMAAQADGDDPLCHFYSARCYEALKQKDHAINSIELALLNIGSKQEFMQWKQKAIEHKQRLTKE